MVSPQLPPLLKQVMEVNQPQVHHLVRHHRQLVRRLARCLVHHHQPKLRQHHLPRPLEDMVEMNNQPHQAVSLLLSVKRVFGCLAAPAIQAPSSAAPTQAPYAGNEAPSVSPTTTAASSSGNPNL